MNLPRTHFLPEHEQFRDSARRFYQKEIGPHAARWREQGCVDREAFVKAGEQGYLILWAEPEYGGLGIADLRYEQVLIEENARYGDVGFFQSTHSMLVAPYIGRFGNAEQKARLLPDLIAGKKILAIAMTEPGAGSDLAAMRTRAEDRGDHWLLNGAKTFISNGTLADVVIVAARTGEARHCVGLFVVEAGMSGFRRGNKLKKLGLHAQDTAELFFDDVRVPKENLLGEATAGFGYLAQCLATERLICAAGSIAHAQVAFDVTLDYVKQRRLFGKPLGALQNTRFTLAGLRSELDAVQCYIDECVLLGSMETLSVEAAAAAKLVATELEGRVVDVGVQLHGGMGYMEESRICRMYADARISRIYAGASEVMKEIIGRGLGLDDRKLT